MPATFNVGPWALLMDMAKLSLTGNCIRLNVNARSLGMTGIRGMNTSSPLAHPVMTVASRGFGMRLFTRSLVPLHSLGASRFRSSMMGAPTFRTRLWGGVPGGSRELRNSAGKSTSCISSPYIMDELFERLEKSGVGCHMGNHCTGSLGYADDLTLLAPTLSGLQVLIKICERYADEFDIKFNGAKSVYMVFGGRRCKCDNRTVMVNGAELHRVNATVHLSHHISTNDNGSLVSAAIGQFWRGFNMFMADFSQIHSHIKCHLFKLYCCSYYGAPLWCLQSNMVSRLCVAWRKASRKIWRLSPRTYNIH